MKGTVPYETVVKRLGSRAYPTPDVSSIIPDHSGHGFAHTLSPSAPPLGWLEQARQQKQQRHELKRLERLEAERQNKLQNRPSGELGGSRPPAEEGRGKASNERPGVPGRPGSAPVPPVRARPASLIDSPRRVYKQAVGEYASLTDPTEILNATMPLQRKSPRHWGGGLGSFKGTMDLDTEKGVLDVDDSNVSEHEDAMGEAGPRGTSRPRSARSHGSARGSSRAGPGSGGEESSAGSEGGAAPLWNEDGAARAATRYDWKFERLQEKKAELARRQARMAQSNIRTSQDLKVVRLQKELQEREEHQNALMWVDRGLPKDDIKVTLHRNAVLDRLAYLTHPVPMQKRDEFLAHMADEHEHAHPNLPSRADLKNFALRNVYARSRQSALRDRWDAYVATNGRVKAPPRTAAGRVVFERARSKFRSFVNALSAMRVMRAEARAQAELGRDPLPESLKPKASARAAAVMLYRTEQVRAALSNLARAEDRAKTAAEELDLERLGSRGKARQAHVKVDLEQEKYSNVLDMSGRDLLKLHDVFHSRQHAGGLIERDFIETFAKFVSLPPPLLRLLFQKMDADGNGILTWDEFTSYLLFEDAARSSAGAAEGLEQLVFDAGELAPHPENIDFAVVVSQGTLMVTVCRDMNLRIWDLATERGPPALLETVHITELGARGLFCPLQVRDGPRLGARGRWHDIVEDIVASEETEPTLQGERMTFCMYEVQPTVARGDVFPPLITGAGEIPKKHDMNFNVPFTPHGRGRGRPYIPFVSTLYYNQLAEELILATCDSRVITFEIVRYTTPDPNAAGKTLNRVELRRVQEFSVPHMATSLSVGYSSLVDKVFVMIGDTEGKVTAYEKTTLNVLYSHHYHTAPISRAETIEGLGILSIGLDSSVRMSDFTHWKCFREFLGHEGGVLCFANCPKARFFATAGDDGDVRIWNPFSDKAITVLKGFDCPVVDLWCNQAANMLIAVSERKQVRVWNTITLKAYQNLEDGSTHAPDDIITATSYDATTNRLYLCGSHAVRLQLKETSDLFHATEGVIFTEDPAAARRRRRLEASAAAASTAAARARAESAASTKSPTAGEHIVSVLYSLPFRQLIATSQAGVIYLFDIRTGVNTYTFKTARNAQVTSACIDYLGRRLVIGFNDGFVGIWNFNNGNMMMEFKRRRREVTSLVFLEPHQDSMHDVAGADWDGQLTLWPSLDIPEHLQFLIEHVGHKGDALCVDACGNAIATGGSEGRVVVWSATSGAVRGAAQMPLRDHRPQSVESLLFLKVRKVLLAGLNDGSVVVCDFENATPKIPAAHRLPGSISAMAADQSNICSIMVDTLGHAVILDVSQVQDSKSCKQEQFQIVRQWQAHPCEITSVCALEAPSLFCTSSVRGEICMWSYEGKPVATIGQAWPKKLPHSNGPIQEIERLLSLRIDALLEKRKSRFYA